MEINVHQFIAQSTENGPGLRAVLWVQGCTLHCPGCFNPDTHSLEPRRLMAVKDVAAALRATPGIEGLTISGGEPFLQAAALAVLGRWLRRRDLGLVVFSGYTLTQLHQAKCPDWEALLATIDLLIAGPFLQTLACDLPLRGSSNQTLHYLTDRYAAWQAVYEQGAHTAEIMISPSGEVIMTGFPDLV